MQAALGFKQKIVILLATFCVILGAEGIEEWEKLSKEEELELDRQLKLINKPPIKRFQSEDGDVIDCVDIYKQLAFDHPMLKNHTIQMKPTTIPKGMTNEYERETYKSSPYMPGKKYCPRGSVPIRRTNRKELIMAKHIKSLGFNHPTNTHANTSSGIAIGRLYSAGLEYRSPIAGGRAKINLWKPSVKSNQFSVGSMWISNGHAEQANIIQAGWGVNPSLGQKGTRLFTHWTADGYSKTGCFNTVCPGFVQVSSKIHLGLSLKPVSGYASPQFDITVSIHQDDGTGNWWLKFFETYVGYWPKAIFSNMGEGANHISWGGQVFSSIKDIDSPMGSGHFPDEGFGKAAYVIHMQVISNGTSEYSDEIGHLLKVHADAPSCYRAIKNLPEPGAWGNYLYFGGPGNCTFQ